MEPDPVLAHDLLLDVHSAAVKAGLAGSRGALLAGIHRSVVAALPDGENPAAQLRTDLDELNRAAIEGGERPLRTWLLNARQLAYPRVEARVFQQALDALDALDARLAATIGDAPAGPGPRGTTPPGPARSGQAPVVTSSRLAPRTLLQVSDVLHGALRAARVPMERLVAQLDMDQGHLRDDDWLGLVNAVHAGMCGPIGDGRTAVLALVKAAQAFVPGSGELRALAASLGGA